MNLSVIVLKGLVLLPNSEIRLEFSDESSKSLIDIATIFHDNKILVANAFNKEDSDINSLDDIGVLGIIKNKIILPSGKTRVTIEGKKRVKVDEYIKVDELIEATVEDLKEEIDTDIINATRRKIKYELKKTIDELPTVSNGVISRIDNIDSLSLMIDIIVTYIPISKNRLCEYANTSSVIKRSEMLKLKVIKEEIGDYSYKTDEINRLRLKLDKLDCRENIKNIIKKEIIHLENIPDISPDISSIRTYINYMLELPWNKTTNDLTDINQISKNLDKTHYALNDVKTRIIEYLAVKKNNPNINSPIICLVGPPGVGKSTLAKSIADSINRKFVKISVAGLTDEAEIIGHMRSYVNASPGKIVTSLIKCKSSNPVILIDEVDKMGSSYKGDPVSTLLDILDSNQNSSFIDNYINIEIDLSRVLFIITANNLDNIPNPLRDRLEIINIEGYSEYEKLDIAKSYLIPNNLELHNINIDIKDEVVLEIIRNYTREYGVRELERNISKICRKVVTKALKDKIDINTLKIDTNNIGDYLGKGINKVSHIDTQVGVVNGLSCTSYGGDILPIEVNYYKGRGKLILTGSLGDVIKESATIALSYIKANYKKFNIRYEDLINNDIHIHIPSGSVSKEGPSAGVALTSSII